MMKALKHRKNTVLDICECQNYKYISIPENGDCRFILPFVGKSGRYTLSRTAVANTLNEEVDFAGAITFRKLYGRDVYIQAVGLAALHTLEVYMVVVMAGRAGLFAKSILQAAFVVEHFVDKSTVEEGLECPVNCYTVEVVLDLFLDIPVREGMALPEEKIKHLLPGRCGP